MSHFVVESFTVPCGELSASVAVQVMLPSNYTSSGKRYPVLYMNDGQGVFFDDARESVEGMRFLPYAEEMAEFLPELIIVAIEAPPTRFERMKWYLPAWNYSQQINDTYGADFQCAGKAYAAWLVDTLKPLIDSKYPTDPSQKATAVGGLSASCIIASYTAGHYADVFSKCMILSPSFFLWWPALEPLFRQLRYDHIDAFFSYVGTNEYGRITQRDEFLQSSAIIEDLLQEDGLDPAALRHITQPGGEHTMVGWRYFFAEGLRWMFRTH